MSEDRFGMPDHAPRHDQPLQSTTATLLGEHLVALFTVIPVARTIGIRIAGITRRNRQYAG